jgi:hypothetical protein
MSCYSTIDYLIIVSGIIISSFYISIELTSISDYLLLELFCPELQLLLSYTTTARECFFGTFDNVKLPYWESSSHFVLVAKYLKLLERVALMLKRLAFSNDCSLFSSIMMKVYLSIMLSIILSFWLVTC